MTQSFNDSAPLALHDVQLQEAMTNAGQGFMAKRAAAVAACDNFPELRSRAKEARDYALNNMASLLEQFEEKVSANGGKVHWAETPEQMREIVLNICSRRNAKYITKGKSMISEEVHLNKALETAGYIVDETDLGEYIIQLANEPPSHIVAPALHKTRWDIESLFKNNHDLGQRELIEVEQIVNEARAVIRSRFLRADVGITGANMLIAETGQVTLVTNEGNGDLTATLPKCHIVTTSIEKVIANHQDANAVLRVLGRSATGQAMTAYTSYFSGIDQGTQSTTPEEFHIVLLDNGRSDMLNSKYKPMLRCIKCAACMNHCPVYQNVGGHAYNAVYPGPMGSILSPLLRGEQRDFQLPVASSVCGRCDEVCPVEIPLTELMRSLRNDHRTSSLLARTMIRLHTYIARSPQIYTFFASIGVLVLNFAGRRQNALKNLPVGKPWFNFKHLSRPNNTTFQQHWQKRDQTK